MSLLGGVTYPQASQTCCDRDFVKLVKGIILQKKNDNMNKNKNQSLYNKASEERYEFHSDFLDQIIKKQSPKDEIERFMQLCVLEGLRFFSF